MSNTTGVINETGTGTLPEHVSSPAVFSVMLNLLFSVLCLYTIDKYFST